VFPSQLELVYLNVVVQDERGRMVTNLGPEDFSVFEDGVVQRVELFGRAHEPGNDELMALDLGMLFDTSESMLKELRLSQEAAARFLESVPRARDLVTVFFDQDIRVSRYDSENQQGLFDRIWAAKGGGNTALYDSVAVYLSRIRDTPGRQVLVLFTDGEDSTSTTTLDDALRLLKASPVTVYAIGFRGGFTPGSTRALTASSVLRAMTGLTGGTLFTPQTSRELPEVYERILNDLQSQYVLGYAPTDARRDGRFRKLKVTLKERGLKVRHRVGYVAEGDQLAVK
jgi:Ca-activated chloride channel family protein